MSEAPETLRLARMWVEKAEEDFLVAELLLSPDESCPFSTVCSENSGESRQTSGSESESVSESKMSIFKGRFRYRFRPRPRQPHENSNAFSCAWVLPWRMGDCFHTQQSVEKYVKALLVSMAIAFPKVHDIGELLELAPASIEIPLSTEEQEQLTFYATTARYPGEYEPISRGEAEEMVAAAKKLRDAVRAYLPKEALNIPTDSPLPQ